MSEIKVGDKYHNRQFPDTYRFTVERVGFKDAPGGVQAVIFRNQNGVEFVVPESHLKGENSKYAPGWPEEQIRPGDKVAYLEGTGLRQHGRVEHIYDTWAWVFFDRYSVSGEVVNLKNLRKKS